MNRHNEQNNEQKEYRKTIPFTIASKEINT
jgi:hypothetical protein